MIEAQNSFQNTWPLFILSMSAGLIILSSTLPRMISILLGKDPMKDSINRNIAMSLGNLLWFSYGLLSNGPAIAIFCGMSCAMHILISCSMIYPSFSRMLMLKFSRLKNLWTDHFFN